MLQSCTYFMLPKCICILLRINFLASCVYKVVLYFYYWYFKSSWNQICVCFAVIMGFDICGCFIFFHWHYSSLWSLVCQTMSFHFFLSATNSLHLLTPNTWRSRSTSSFHLFLGLPLLLVPSSSWVKIFLGILFSSILSRWPNQLILCPLIHFTIFSPLLISSSSRFVRLFHSPFSYLGPYFLLNIFLSKISRACSSFFIRFFFGPG